MNSSGITPFGMTKERRAELEVAKATGDEEKQNELFLKQEGQNRAWRSKGGEKGFM